ncbi:MAG TPA: hypothetical protein DIC52_21880 [Candidatus Latescibacteria bacterium]|nr:hypothetical protein [Candidatus Latescibacterota bacterium]
MPGSDTGLLTLVALGLCACTTLRGLAEPDVEVAAAASRPLPRDFDTGQYGGVVLEDPQAKQNIQGFVYLSLAWGSRLRPAYPRAIAALAEALNKDTHIRAKVTAHTSLGSAELHRRPFLYISAAEAFDLSSQELENLGRYIKSGGFVLVDNGRPDLGFGPAEASLRNMLSAALPGLGKPVKIPDRHAIYHSFFELQGPPFGGDYEPGAFAARQRPPPVESLEGIFVNGRLAVVYSDMGYGGFWQQPFENEPQLKMGINLVVFALTQQGSLARNLEP